MDGCRWNKHPKGHERRRERAKPRGAQANSLASMTASHRGTRGLLNKHQPPGEGSVWRSCSSSNISSADRELYVRDYTVALVVDDRSIDRDKKKQNRKAGATTQKSKERRTELVL